MDEIILDNLDRYLEKLRLVGLLEGRKLENEEMGYKPSLKCINLVKKLMLQLYEKNYSFKTDIKKIWQGAIMLTILETFNRWMETEEITIYSNVLETIWEVGLKHKGISLEKWLKKLPDPSIFNV